jgi:hypothetical protein
VGRKAKIKKKRNLIKKYQQIIQKYRNRPDLWIEEILGFKLLDYQRLWLRLTWKFRKIN